MALMRPLSGSGSLGIFSELVATHGPDSILARMGRNDHGQHGNNLLLLAVYFGSVAIRRTRHAVPAGLLADVAGMIASIIVCRIVFG